MRGLIGFSFVMASAMMASAAETVSTNTPAATPEAVKKEAVCPVTVGATLDLYSAYVWHGMVLNDEPVWQPDAAISYSLGDYGTLAADAWMNFDATDNNDRRQFSGLNEIDYTLQYSVNVGNLALGAGHIWYTFPSISSGEYSPSTREFFVSAAYNNNIVTPFVKGYYDYARADGAYLTIGLRKEVELIDKLTAGAEVALDGATHTYTQFYFNGAENNAWFTDGTAAVYVKYNISANFYVGARLAWISVMDNDLKGVYQEDNLLWGGINLGATL
ncbi:MAG: hypothetical protein WCP12_09395 [bacterium]